MARYLTVLLAAMAVAAALLWLPGEQPSTKGKSGPETAAGHMREAESPAGILDELAVPFARRSSGLIVCPDSGDEKSDDERMAEYEAQRAEMLRVLGASADAEHLFIAALVSWTKQPVNAVKMLDRAAAMDPRNPLIASQALGLCLEIETCERAPAELERRLIAADKANALAWVQVARSRLGRNDEPGALAAMREAAAAPQVNEYFSSNVLLFERGLAASTDLGPFDRITASIGHAAAVFSGSFMIFKDCVERAKGSAEWRDVCLRLGQQLEHGGRTILSQSIGMNIQAKMYEYGGDTREQRDVEVRQDRFESDWSALMNITARSAQLRNATVARQYLETFETAGELAAMRYLAAEVEARLPAPGGAADSACPTP
jgi:hypothetical protein